MVDGKCGGEFRRFRALSLDGVVPWLFQKSIFFNFCVGAELFF